MISRRFFAPSFARARLAHACSCSLLQGLDGYRSTACIEPLGLRHDAATLSKSRVHIHRFQIPPG